MSLFGFELFTYVHYGFHMAIFVPLFSPPLQGTMDRSPLVYSWVTDLTIVQNLQAQIVWRAQILQMHLSLSLSLSLSTMACIWHIP